MNTIDIYSDNPNVTLEYMIAVMQAAATGVSVQCRSSHTKNSWLPVIGSDNPDKWNWGTWHYRIDPNSRPKRTVPMERDDYPPFFWLKCPHSGMHKLPLAVGCDGIRVEMGETIITICWATIINWKWQYSTDRKVWLPCTKEVSA